MVYTGEEVYFILNLSLKMCDTSLQIIVLFSFRLNQPKHQNVFLQMLLTGAHHEE